MINSLTPRYLRQLLPQRVKKQARYSLRNNNNFSIPGARTNLHFNSFLLSALRQWNMLEQDIRDSPTLYAFKHKLNAQQQQAPPHHFNVLQTSRLGQILHARLRLECSSLNHHLYRKNLVESPLCSCGVPETNSHFLLACANYSNARQRYFSGLGLPLTVNTLLNGKPEENLEVNSNIFRRVQLYIMATKRFSQSNILLHTSKGLSRAGDTKY